MALLRRSSLIDLVQDLSTRWRSDLGFCAFKVETDSTALSHLTLDFWLMNVTLVPKVFKTQQRIL